MKRLGFLLALIIGSTTIAATGIVASKQAVARIGPFYTSTVAFDTLTGGGAGGHVQFFKNGVDTLIVGDVVYISAQNTVRKSATLASYNTLAGVVVGGTRTKMQAFTTAPASTDTAATANQQVIVLTEGRFWVRVDTTTGGIAAGTLIMPSLVAGKVKAKSSVLDSLSRVVGRMIDSSAISVQALAHISIK